MLHIGSNTSNERAKTTHGGDHTIPICEHEGLDHFQSRNRNSKLMHDFESRRNESIIKDDRNTINVDEKQNMAEYKKIKDEDEILAYERTSPTSFVRNSTCLQLHQEVQDVDNSNLEEIIFFGLCEENPSLQEIIGPTNQPIKKQCVVEIPTFHEFDNKHEEDGLHHKELGLVIMYNQNPIYECHEHSNSSSLNLVENHGFQQAMEGQTIKEMLDTSLPNGCHDFGDRFIYNDGQCKALTEFENEGFFPRISQQDLQQVIIKQLDLEESHVFAESIEDHGSKEMQESPIGSEGQDFLDEIMTCEIENNTVVETKVEQVDAYNCCREDCDVNQAKENWAEHDNNCNCILEHEYDNCLTTNKHVDLEIEKNRKQKRSPCEEQCETCHAQNLDKSRNYYGRLEKQRMSHSLYQTEDPYENQDATMKKTVKEFKVKQSPIDGYQYKDSRFQTEKNYIERSHCQIRWKTPTDVSSDLENSREITLCNKALPAGKKSNDGGNSFSRATLCSNPCQQKEQITRAASKTIHCGKDFPCKSKAQNVDPNRVGESLCHPNVLPDNEGFPEFTNPLTGWVYHTNNGTISKFYTLKQLQRGLKSGFLPANLPIYQVQENIYTGPFVLKLLIERNEFLASHTMNDLQQPMEMKNLDYVHNMKSKLTTHALNVRPLSHGPTPVLTTTVWPNAKMGSAIAAAEQQQQHYLHQHKGDDNQGGRGT
nr:uncharacterized protein LOC112290765 [Physcomitrium patens]|eukprot:XP_024393197.1 uncharacterized protein LOC112290765 [Physcomitrella patens]